MLQRPFLKLKKHSPTNLYMIYPMVHSVLLLCVKIDKKMPLQCKGIVYCCHHHVKKQNHFGMQASFYLKIISFHQNLNLPWDDLTILLLLLSLVDLCK
jgi:hypothetical protein